MDFLFFYLNYAIDKLKHAKTNGKDTVWPFKELNLRALCAAGILLHNTVAIVVEKKTETNAAI